jgi:septal ring factor EnvC (AmiA/AmiB activator)
LATKLRKEFIKLLEKDPEFRQTVAGYLGLAETLKKLDQHLEELRSIRQEQQKTWQNIERLWQEVRELRQDQTKLWEEVRELRHDFIVFRTELTGISATVGAIAESGARRALRE